MGDDNSHRSSVSSSVDDTSLVEDEDFQVVNPQRKASSRRASLAASTHTAGSQEDISAIGQDDETVDASDDTVGATDRTNAEREELLYGPKAQSAAVRNLIFFSILMFTLPLGVVYVAYLYFLEYFPRNEAALYAGILGAGVVYLIVMAFIWIAYREERNDEKLIQKPTTISKKTE